MTTVIANKSHDFFLGLARGVAQEVHKEVVRVHRGTWDPGAEHAGQAPDYDAPETWTCGGCDFVCHGENSAECERARLEHIYEMERQGRLVISQSLMPSP
jgi:hypothetical protein